MKSRSSCDEFDALMEEWGPAAPADIRSRLEVHAAGCSRCAAVLDREDALERLLEQRLRPPALREGFSRHVLERIEALSAGLELPRWLAWVEAAAGAGLAAAVAIAISLAGLEKVLTSLPAPTPAHVFWAAAVPLLTMLLWLACEALADLRGPFR